MCSAIYLTLFGLLVVYAGYTLDQYALSVNVAEGDWMVVAMGWEMLTHLWPLLLIGGVVGSGATLFVVRRLGAGKG